LAKTKNGWRHGLESAHSLAPFLRQSKRLIDVEESYHDGLLWVSCLRKEGKQMARGQFFKEG
jgi:hypothetical protein